MLEDEWEERESRQGVLCGWAGTCVDGHPPSSAQPKSQCFVPKGGLDEGGEIRKREGSNGSLVASSTQLLKYKRPLHTQTHTHMHTHIHTRTRKHPTHKHTRTPTPTNTHIHAHIHTDTPKYTCISSWSSFTVCKAYLGFKTNIMDKHAWNKIHIQIPCLALLPPPPSQTHIHTSTHNSHLLSAAELISTGSPGKKCRLRMAASCASRCMQRTFSLIKEMVYTENKEKRKKEKGGRGFKGHTRGAGRQSIMKRQFPHVPK